MNRCTSILIVFFAFFLATSQMHAKENSASKFGKIKSLAGEWKGTRGDGKAVTIVYEVISNGSTVMERMMPEDEPNMVTMYHLDGDDLLMTHYCAVNNQPRMKSVHSDETNVVKFELKDITNLANESDGHMTKMAITFKDSDHIAHLWTYAHEGKEQAAPFDLERQKISMK